MAVLLARLRVFVVERSWFIWNDRVEDDCDCLNLRGMALRGYAGGYWTGPGSVNCRRLLTPVEPTNGLECNHERGVVFGRRGVTVTMDRDNGRGRLQDQGL